MKALRARRKEHEAMVLQREEVTHDVYFSRVFAGSVML